MTLLRRAFASIALLLTLLGGSALASSVHEVTHKGTVVSADAKTVVITVVNAKTKKPESMTFKHDGETKVLRGDKVVKFAEAKIQKDEKISVTVNHDDLPDFALTIRLDDKK